MLKTYFKYTILIFIISILCKSYALSANVKEIKIIGNERIPNETILMFADVKENEHINNERVNQILKNLYGSNFFDEVTVNFNENTLIITVTELPIIDKITYNGIKAKKVKEAITKDLKLKSRSSIIL